MEFDKVKKSNSNDSYDSLTKKTECCNSMWYGKMSIWECFRKDGSLWCYN
jgi:hypothetical protein